MLSEVGALRLSVELARDMGTDPVRGSDSSELDAPEDSVRFTRLWPAMLAVVEDIAPASNCEKVYLAKREEPSGVHKLKLMTVLEAMLSTTVASRLLLSSSL